MIRQTLLLEIGTEELPPKTLRNLAKALADGVGDGLSECKLGFADVMYYATPRRLAVMVSELESEQPDRVVQKKGPAMNVAYDDAGQPTVAALGFARSCGIAVNALDKVVTDKGSWLSYSAKEIGLSTAVLVPSIVESTLATLPIAKKMRWGVNDVEFVRPVHWFVALFGSSLIECSVFGVGSTRQTFGHRFHCPQAIHLESATDYLPQLRNLGKVIADFAERKEIIRQAMDKVADDVDGKVLLSDDLLNEVTALVEWPVAILGTFDKRFLSLPREVLIATMQDHQKYFPLVDSDGSLLPCFVSVVNVESKFPQQIRAGNERVIVPRLSDAEFFWQQDSQRMLVDLRPELANVVFQQQLGSIYEKSERLVSLVVAIADGSAVDVTLLKRAAALSKCDLLTHMVTEFPALQGIMGRHYAIQNGEDGVVALALAEQYMPRFAGDAVATSEVGQLLAIADKLDTLVGIFAIGEVPSGDKDPFSLRRMALGVLRTAIEMKLNVDIQECLRHAVANYPQELMGDQQQQDELLTQVLDFMMDRLRGYYVEKATPVDHFLAVLACRPTKPYDFDLRITAVAEFRKLPQAEALIAANKRVANILKQHQGKDVVEFDKGLLESGAEQKFSVALDVSRDQVNTLLHDREYTVALGELAGLRVCIDEFFDNVMVMCDDLALRNNRIALLRRLHVLFLGIADVSRLQ